MNTIKEILESNVDKNLKAIVTLINKHCSDNPSINTIPTRELNKEWKKLLSENTYQEGLCHYIFSKAKNTIRIKPYKYSHRIHSCPHCGKELNSNH